MSRQTGPIYRLVIFVPISDLDTVRQGIIDQMNKLRIHHGKYAEVLHETLGWVERFQPLEGANPKQGQVGQTQISESARIEFSIPRDEFLLHTVINDGIVAHHPWEEPIILIYPVFQLVPSKQILKSP